MLQQFSRRSILILLILSLLCSASVQAATGTLNANAGIRHEVCTELSAQAASYYSGEYTYELLSSMNGVSAPDDSWAATQGNDLYDALQELMSSTQETYPQYSGYYTNSLATYWSKTDATAGSSSYLYFYTDVLSTDVSATMNREHVWPQSNASFYQKNGGADLHHLRPSIQSVNSAKSNYTFADVVDNLYGYSTSYISGEPVIWYHSDSKVLEVRDNVKGDVARILLYVYCRWGQPNLYTDVSSSKLPALDSDDSSNNGVRAIDDLETLLRWCELDPVDSWEMGRNDQAENVQGNRNVFIDYPEFAWLLFDRIPPADMSTPSGEAANASYTITVSSCNSDYGIVSLDGNIITATPAKGYVVSGYTLLSGQATVVQDGNTFTVTPQSDCTIRIDFICATTVTLTFSAADPISGYAGESFTLPDAASPDGYKFLGWCTETVSDCTAPPAYYEAGSSHTVTASTHFYALYAYEKEVIDDTADYVKVTDTPSDWSGEYVIVYEGSSYIFNGSLTSPNQRYNYKAVSIQDSRITAASADDYCVTIAPCTEGYSIRTASGLYIGNTTTGSSLSSSSTTVYPNTITLNSDGTVHIAASGGTILRYYGSTQRRFLYSTVSSGYYYDICLYRKDSHTVSTFYTTEVCIHKNTEEVTTSATCEADGTLTVVCADCGEIIGSTVLSATGHSYSYTDNGDGTHTGICSRCDKPLTESHEFTDGTCICGAVELTVDESVKIYHALNLASDISISFVVPQTALADYDSYYMEVVLPEYEGNEQIGTSAVQIQPVVNGNYYYFTLTGITAVRMGDLVEATLHMTRGTAQYVSNADTYSVATYAYAMLNSTTDTYMQTLCADLLRYGAEAQSYKGYRTDALVDADMTETHRSYLSVTENLTFTATDSYLGDLDNATVTWLGKTLDLGSKVGMKFVFSTQNYTGDISALSMVVSYAGSNGETKTVTLTGAEAYGTSGNYYSFTFYGLLASELRTVVDVAVYEGETRLSETLRYSAESYASKNTTGTLAPLCNALFAYSDSAKAYFAQ